MAYIEERNPKQYTFQRDSKEFILNTFKRGNAALLADETGLGKTNVARDVIEALAVKFFEDHKGKTYRVLYICSNLALAKKNVDKLKRDVKIKGPGDSIIKPDQSNDADRLSLLYEKLEKYDETSSAMKYYAITPGISLEGTIGGTSDEKKKVSELYKRIIDNEEQFKMFDNKCKELIEVTKRLIEIRKKFSKSESDNYYKEFNLKWNEIDFIKENWIEEASKLITDKIMRELISWKKKSIYEEEDIRSIFGKTAEGVSEILMFLNDYIHKYLKCKEVHGIIDKLEIKNGSARKNCVCALCQKDYTAIYKYQIDNSGNVDGINIDVYSEYYSVVKANLEKKIVEDLTSVVNDKEENGLNTDFKEKIECVLGSMLDRQIFINQRKVACIYSLMLMKPNIVVIDELQTYPELFVNNEQEDESSMLVRLVMDTVLEQNITDEKKNGEVETKVLMLSATPYAYRNFMEVGENNEDDEFLKHLVGIEEIINYLGDKNNVSNAFEDWRELNDKLNAVYNSLKRQVSEKDIKEYSRISVLISELLKKVGVTRVERPLSSYNSNSADELTVGIGKITIDDFLPVAYNNNIKISARKALSISRREYGMEENARIKCLLEKLENLRGLLFIPPTKPQHELSGFFEEKKDISKLILYSAYNQVPADLSRIINNSFTGCNKKVFNEGSLFEKALDTAKSSCVDNSNLDNKSFHIWNYFKTEFGDNDETEKMSKILYERFNNKYAQKCIGAENVSDENEYLKKIHVYCYQGDFESVLKEFFYVFYADNRKRVVYDNEKRPVEELSKKTREELKELCNYLEMEGENNLFAYTYSSAPNNNTKIAFERQVDYFQTPFFPFAICMTSVAQEGFDFHWYSDTIFHWNVPNSPIALIQREGRINRYNCLAVRKKVAELVKDEGVEASSWDEMFKKLEKEEKDHGLYPHWIIPGSNIKRMCFYFKYSEEYHRWMELMKKMNYYRGLLGAVEMPEEVLQVAKRIPGIENIFIDLYPSITDRFEFRSIRPEEIGQAVVIEQICFPPHEACSEKSMTERIAKAADLFLVAVDKETGKLAGFLNGLSTNETAFRDEFFTDAGLYDPEGKAVMLLGLDVLPQYRGQGLARELVKQYACREQKNHRNLLILTCLDEKVEMYKKMGFGDDGIANSTWGGEEWHQMSCPIAQE